MTAGVRFEVGDGWDSYGLQQLGVPFNVIFVDIGGLSGTEGQFEAVALIRQLCRAFQPSLRAIVIKSRCMRDHSMQFVDARGWLHERYMRAKALVPVDDQPNPKLEADAKPS